MHLALGELYEKLTDFADDLAEMYMGKYGEDLNVHQSDPNHFDESDPLSFIAQLFAALEQLEATVPKDGFLLNKYQELLGDVSRIKYKLENLK
jgi:hypothetical protein